MADEKALFLFATGAGCPMVIAPSMNHGLWSHPQITASSDRLISWSCEIVPPTITDQSGTMAPVEFILQTILRVQNAG